MMSNSICRFVPVKDYNANIRTIHFVYETDFHKFSQPFIKPIYYAYIIVKGEGVLKMLSSEYYLKRGTLFFTFPGQPFEIEAEDEFEYYYISFMGTNINNMLERLEITPINPVFADFEHILGFWEDSIRRINVTNANILTESVLLYTLSFINNQTSNSHTKAKNLFEEIVEYIDANYTHRDISLKKIADIFSYTPKYVSYLLKKNLNVKFTDYLTSLRIQYALSLIDQNERVVSVISAKCGFSDAPYFSKVFKEALGTSPSEYIKSKI